MVAGSEETNAEDRQVEKVADGGLDINAIPKEKTCNVTKFERYSFSSQDSLIFLEEMQKSREINSLIVEKSRGSANVETHLKSGEVEKSQTVDQLKCSNGEANRVIWQLGWTAGRR
jgi:hypothetical protein